MSQDTDFLLRSAARLYSLGVDLECAREEVRRLAGGGDTPELREAVESFRELESQWKALEREHLSLRQEIHTKKTSP